MYLRAYHISKSFLGKEVVSQVSFCIEKGEILGLLGPNGAGKSTTMRILTGYLPPDHGQVQICGHDVGIEPVLAKSKVGYLPEQNPLYVDMYVQEYLLFIANLYKLSRHYAKERIKVLVEQCNLGEVHSKKIGALSKGYKQRVGIARALVHDPPVLILDEPTVGLDPNQLQQIRSLIRELSNDKAILLSTHLLAEVETGCTQVAIMHQGRLLLYTTLQELRLQGSSQVILTFKEPIPTQVLSSGDLSLQSVEILDAYRCILHTKQGQSVQDAVFNLAKKFGLTLQRMEQRKEDLETIFMRLTQSNPT